MLHTAERFNPRLYRYLLVVGALALFLAVWALLLGYGYLHVSRSAAVLLLGVWAVGLLGLLLTDDRIAGQFPAGPAGTWLSGQALTFVRALWCNLGFVATALLIPDPMRLLVLVAPLFGVLYAALYLDRGRMFTVALVTWAAYLAGALLLWRLDVVEGQVELLLALAFTAMLAVMALMASEVTALKTAFERRRDGLNRAMEQLAELAMRDELTGLYNRRYIMDVLTRQKAMADRGHPGFTLCYCDLDHFKRVNDRHGHQAGDRVLEEFAEVARGVVRSVDYVARLGGEEFLLVLIGADAGKADAVARRLCERSKSVAMVADAPDLRLTVSVGIASYRTGERIEDVIQRADLALYAAKSAGRDRIVIGE